MAKIIEFPYDNIDTLNYQRIHFEYDWNFGDIILFYESGIDYIQDSFKISFVTHDKELINPDSFDDEDVLIFPQEIIKEINDPLQYYKQILDQGRLIHSTIYFILDSSHPFCNGEVPDDCSLIFTLENSYNEGIYNAEREIMTNDDLISKFLIE